MTKLLLPVIFLFICIQQFAFSKVEAQTPSENNSSVKIDNLYELHASELRKVQLSTGLNDLPIMKRARNNGLSASQVQKIQNKLESKTEDGKFSAVDMDLNQNGTTGRQLNFQPDLNEDTRLGKSTASGQGPEIFGASIFANKNNSFEPNFKIATPLNYVLGPDDQLAVNIYGQSLANWKLLISSEGDVNIPGIGILNIGSRTIEQATRLLKARLSANKYSIGHGTFMQISLLNIRSIHIVIIGQVIKPGTYTLPSLATVFNALYMAGGPNTSGSLRQIEVIRNNQVIRRLDVYDFLTRGDQKNNILLQDQDIVRVPTYRNRIELEGQVKIPALFEVLPGETLADMLGFAGGFTENAYTALIKVSQISDQQRKITDIPEADYKNYLPLRGDKFLVEAIINRFKNRVIIQGAVFKPGDFELQKGLTLSQLINNAAGLKEEAFTDRGTIIRLRPDNSQEIVSFNVRDIINKKTDIPLQREDIVNISTKSELKDSPQVTINGSVRSPGIFDFLGNMKVEDLIIKAGGFSEGASLTRIEVARRTSDADPSSKNSSIAKIFTIDVKGPLQPGKANFELNPFDIVSVYSLPGYEKQKTVRIEGEVLYPGTYTLKNKNEKISDLVKRAGGLTVSADLNGSSLTRENIALMGIDKNKADALTLNLEKTIQIRRLRETYKDSTNNSDLQQRNNYIGIELNKIIRSPQSVADILLEEGDVLRIPKKQQIVRVDGQVLYPSAIIYRKIYSFYDFITNAGGYAPRALRRKAYVVYANGTVKGTRRYLLFNIHPSVLPGCEIFIPRKAERRGNTSQELLSYTTGVAALVAITLGILSFLK